jgi:hypothetical protein
MLFAGGVSIIAGVAYVIAAAGADPMLNMLVLYSAAGRTDFVVEAFPPSPMPTATACCRSPST